MSVARFVLIEISFNLCRFLFFNVKYKLNLCCSRYMNFGCKSTLVYMFTAVPGNIVHIDHVSNNPNTFKGIISCLISKTLGVQITNIKISGSDGALFLPSIIHSK